MEGGPLRKANMPVALAASVLLHLAAVLLLAHGGHSGAYASNEPMVLTVTIVQSEAHSQPAAQQAAPAETPPKPEPGNVTRPVSHVALSAPSILPQQHYYAASELDVIPQVQPDFELYPEYLQHFKRGGKLVISLWIDEHGRVEKTEVMKSELPEIFSEVAMRSFMQASFSPGRKNDLAVKSRVEAVLAFPAHDS